MERRCVCWLNWPGFKCESLHWATGKLVEALFYKEKKIVKKLPSLRERAERERGQRHRDGQNNEQKHQMLIGRCEGFIMLLAKY